MIAFLGFVYRHYSLHNPTEMPQAGPPTCSHYPVLARLWCVLLRPTGIPLADDSEHLRRRTFLASYRLHIRPRSGMPHVRPRLYAVHGLLLDEILNRVLYRNGLEWSAA